MKNWTYTPITAIRSLEDAEAFQESMRYFAREHWPRWKDEMRFRSCPFCGLDDPELEPPFADAFPVSRCRACNSLYVNPVPTDAQLKSFYSESEPIRILNDIYTRRSRQSAGFVSDTRLDKVMSCFAKLSSDHDDGLSVLEVGCNNGRFIEGLVAKAEDAKVIVNRAIGIDIDDTVLPDSRSGGPEYYAIDLHEAALQQEFRNRFDLVCHFELIEHLTDPARFMKDAAEILRPGGFMVFTTPNAAGMEMEAAGYNEYRLMSHAIFPPMHLNAFSVYNVTLFAVRCGYRMISMETPGRLDVDCAIRYVQKGGAGESIFQSLAELDEDRLAIFQALVARLRASSTLLVVLQKPDTPET